MAVASRPVDDALPHLAADMRRCGFGLRESLFVGPVERPGAPAAASVAFGSDAAPWLPHGF
ncbi:hypothetical protein [Streptomyces lydicus]|uniref:hypothetical protein n=1 Tax=Streptomyces lydicus TaxID=47763 RepID=UPI0036E05C70